jgi:hypothetical protein
MSKNILQIEKIKFIEAIKYNLEQMAKMVGGNYKIKLDYQNERLIGTKGIIIKTEVSNKSFDEIIDEFLNKKYEI